MKRELFGLTDEHGNKVSIVLGGDSMPTDGNAYWDIIQIKALAPVEEKKAPEFKVGDWIKHDNDIYRIENIEKDGWINGDTPGGGWHVNHLRLATLQEIQDHLKKICDEKYIGKKIRCLVDNEIYLVSNENHPAGYEKGYDQFWMTPDKDIGICVYKDGKWAEIILDVPDKKKLPKTKEEFEEFIHLIKKEIAFTGINNMSADRFLYDYED